MPDTTSEIDVDWHDVSLVAFRLCTFQLRHPNLVQLVDLFSSSTVPAPDPKDVYIVTEAMDCDLGALINSPWECSYELNGKPPRPGPARPGPPPRLWLYLPASGCICPIRCGRERAQLPMQHDF